MKPAVRRDGGRFVVIVGPDGVGKTTLAKALVERFPGSTAYVHFVPPLLGRLHRCPPDNAVPAPSKGPPDGSRILGCLRLARNFARFWIGYIGSVRPALRRGSLVVADRWAYGYWAQPNALKFYGPSRIAALAVRALPRPDLVVNLAAPPRLIRERKDELTLPQINAELRAWASLPEPRLKTFDAMESPDAIAVRVMREL